MKDRLLNRLLRRESGGHPRQTPIKAIYGDKAFVEDLDIVNELGGHSGCVNALRYVAAHCKVTVQVSVH